MTAPVHARFVPSARRSEPRPGVGISDGSDTACAGAGPAAEHFGLVTCPACRQVAADRAAAMSAGAFTVHEGPCPGCAP